MTSGFLVALGSFDSSRTAGVRAAEVTLGANGSVATTSGDPVHYFNDLSVTVVMMVVVSSCRFRAGRGLERDCECYGCD